MSGSFETEDNADLEALFDQIRMQASNAAPTSAPVTTNLSDDIVLFDMPSTSTTNNLSDDVVLFAPATPLAVAPAPSNNNDYPTNQDSADLENLFDLVSAQSKANASATTAQPAPAPANSGITNTQDSDDLQALFDSIQQKNQDNQIHSSLQLDASADPESMYLQVGQMARKLHDSLRQIGYEKSLEKVAESIPDAKDRLSYIANLTEKAADRVLNATDIAKPLQDELQANAKHLSEGWEKLYAHQLSLDEFKVLARETRAYLKTAPQLTQMTNDQLLEIVLAQDFQDLTGQVIKKVTDMIKNLEAELVNFLIEFSPQEKKADLESSLLNGPVINPEGRSDVVANQQQVDDLLESLGF